MKEIIDQPQKSDMGNGWGHFEFPLGTTLLDALSWIKANRKTWGTVKIYRNTTCIRYFDFDLFNNKIFYHHLSGWEYKTLVREIQFSYCFMSEDITIYLV